VGGNRRLRPSDEGVGGRSEIECALVKDHPGEDEPQEPLPTEGRRWGGAATGLARLGSRRDGRRLRSRVDENAYVLPALSTKSPRESAAIDGKKEASRDTNRRSSQAIITRGLGSKVPRRLLEAGSMAIWLERVAMKGVRFRCCRSLRKPISFANPVMRVHRLAQPGVWVRVFQHICSRLDGRRRCCLLDVNRERRL
jgi:hypothetical protein